MKVLITGGTGFVGRALTDRLLELGHTPLVATRDPSRSREAQQNPGIEYVKFPDGPGGGLDLAGVDAVVHLAGEPAVGVRYTDELKKRIWSSRIETAQAITRAIEVAGDRGPKRFLSASGVGYYGPRSFDERLDETAPAGKDFLAQVCVAWEAEVRAAEAFGTSTASLRFGVVLAADGGALEVMARPFKLFVGGPLGSGEQGMSWVHLRDVIGAIELLLSRPDLRGSFNVVAPHAVTNGEFSRVLGRVLRRPAVFKTPALALEALFGEGAGPILTGQHAVPARLMEAGFKFQFPDLEPALRNCLQS
jgi:uncharacterized protein